MNGGGHGLALALALVLTLALTLGLALTLAPALALALAPAPASVGVVTGFADTLTLAYADVSLFSTNHRPAWITFDIGVSDQV